MGNLGTMCCAFWLALCGAATAADFWTPVEDVDVVVVRVHWVSVGELRAAAKMVGKRPQTKPMGFSVLRKNTETGAYSCDIYFARVPTRLKDDATALIGHEFLHCLAFRHD